MRNLLGATALALAVAVGAGVSPSVAASDSAAVVEVKGHVTDADGHAVKNITVSSGCSCDFEGTKGAPKYSSGKDLSSSTGYFAYKVQKRYATNIAFTDTKDKYLPAGSNNATITKRGTGYVITAKLVLASEIAGTVTDDAGAPVSGALVELSDADTGKQVGTGTTNKLGRYHAQVPGGSYKLRIIGASFYYTTEWLGDAATKEASPTVAVTAGGKTAGINATISKKQSVAGAIHVDGKDPIPLTDESITVTLLNADGATVDTEQTVNNYGFSGFAPGTYTLQYAPTSGGAAFFTPLTQTVTIAQGVNVADQDVELTSIPPVAGEQRTVALDLTYKSRTPKKGEAFRGTVSVATYGDVTGGTVEIYAGSKLLATKTVPTSGEVAFGTRFAGVEPGNFTFRVKYSGTDSTAKAYQRLSIVNLKK